MSNTDGVTLTHSQSVTRLAEITADVVAEDSTALLVLQWRAMWRSIPRRSRGGLTGRRPRTIFMPGTPGSWDRRKACKIGRAHV